tara:strand:+ start:3055 stop:3450 length:396 start_codon:yes stop_codon:yes gene_type:complete
MSANTRETVASQVTYGRIVSGIFQPVASATSASVISQPASSSAGNRYVRRTWRTWVSVILIASSRDCTSIHTGAFRGIVAIWSRDSSSRPNASIEASNSSTLSAIATINQGCVLGVEDANNVVDFELGLGG